MRTAIIALLACIGLAAAGGCGKWMRHGFGAQVTGSGKSITETRKVDAFEKISVHGSMDCEVTVGPAQKVEVIGDDNIVPHVETRVEDGTLHIDLRKSVNTKSNLVVKVEVPSLSAYSIAGSGDGRITGIRASEFAASISGSGDIQGSGSSDSITASIAGSGDIDLSKVAAKRATASISGSGDISLHAADSLKASIAGSGDIECFGGPKKVEKSVVGSGDVRVR